MGHTSVSFHFRTTDETALNTLLVERGISHFLIAPAKNGWVSLYEERASRQVTRLICDLAAGLSQDLKTAAIAFSIHDSDVARYWLYENGKLLDEFNSCPDYFSGFGGQAPSTSRGFQPDILLRFCLGGVSEDDLSEILGANALTEDLIEQLCNEEITEKTFTETFNRNYVPAEDLIAKLAEKMGISPERALADYRGGVPEGD